VLTVWEKDVNGLVSADVEGLRIVEALKVSEEESFGAN